MRTFWLIASTLATIIGFLVMATVFLAISSTIVMLVGLPSILVILACLALAIFVSKPPPLRPRSKQ